MYTICDDKLQMSQSGQSLRQMFILADILIL